MCGHTAIEAADQTCYLTQSQHNNTRPTSSSADPKLCQVPLEYQVLTHWYDATRKKIYGEAGIEPRSATLQADLLPLSQPGGNQRRELGERGPLSQLLHDC